LLPSRPLYGESLGLALVHCLIRRYSVRAPREREHKGGMPTARLHRVLEFMHQNFAKEARLWELAELAGMSPHYFCDLLRRALALALTSICYGNRLERAKIFLRSSQYGINQVAKATGFVDQNHFTKVFRRIWGVTPTQFRQMF
jgi:AraC family transcriptional regulator